MNMISVIKEASDAGIRLYVENRKLRANVPSEKIPLRLQAMISEHKNEIIDFLNGEGEGNAVARPKDENTNARIPLSFAQQRLWFEDRMSQGSAHYNIQLLDMLLGKFLQSDFGRALNSLVKRHEILRTCYREQDGEPFQVIHTCDTLNFDIIDLREQSENCRNLDSKREITLENTKSFDLTFDLPLRVKIIRLSEEETLCVITVHHIACDGWSVNILLKELNILYESFKTAQGDELPKLPLQYKDYARWQRSEAMDSVKNAQLSYWRNQLCDIPPVHQLPLDFIRPPQQSHVGMGIKRVYRNEYVQELRSLCQQHEVTLFIFLHTVFTIFLNRFSGSNDIVVGSPISGRIKKELEPLIGCFVNSLVLRTTIERDTTFVEQLKKNRRTIFDAYENQHLPFEFLVESLSPAQDLRFTPFFQIVFTLQNNNEGKSATATSDDKKNIGCSGNTKWQVIDQVSVKSDLELHVVEKNNELSFSWIYCSALFKAETIKSMMISFDHMMTSITASFRDGLRPNARISSFDLVSGYEKRQLIQSEQASPIAVENFKYFHELVEAHARFSSDSIAVVVNNAFISYRELNRRANQLAHFLMLIGVGPEELVGILLSRSLEMIVAVLAVLKAGGAYLPLDPKAPSARLMHIIAKSHCKVLLLDSNSSKHGSSFTQQKAYYIDGLAFEKILSRQPIDDVSVDTCKLSPDNLAYSIFTSGTTGLPKGVLLTHRGLKNLINAQKKLFQTNRKAKILQFSSFGFDAATGDIAMALSAGATLYLPDEEQLASVSAITKIIINAGITHALLPPALLSGLDRSQLSHHVKCLIVGGEALDSSTAKFWSHNRLFYNAYGPTEATVCATIAKYTDGPVTIGKSIPNHQCYVLDEDQNILPIGAIGELCIGGLGLARGYHRQASQTAEKFIPSCFSSNPGERLYRTGDNVRRLHNGELQFIGRVDTQIKIRGFRIELEEIKAQLMIDKRVVDAAVLLHNINDSPGLFCFVVSNSCEDNDKLSRSLKQILEQFLPHYMVPHSIQLISSLPVTINGKLDTKQLKSLVQPLPTGYLAPENKTEKRMAELWRKILPREKIGIHDDFFDIGGHSLLAMKLVSQIEQEFNIKLPLTTIFQSPTLESMSKLVADSEGEQIVLSTSIIALGDDLQLTPVYCCLGLGQLPMVLRALQDQLRSQFNLNVLQMPETRKEDGSVQTVSLAAYNLAAAIIEVQPTGCVNLLGHSFGGCIAFEIAHALKTKKCDVKLVLIDCFFDFFKDSYRDTAPEIISNEMLNKLDPLYGLTKQASTCRGNMSADGTGKQSPAVPVLSAHNREREATVTGLYSTLIETQFTMLKNYTTSGPYDGEIQVIFARDGICGSKSIRKEIKDLYEPLCRQDIGYMFSDGGHTSLFQEPHVSDLARALRSCLS